MRKWQHDQQEPASDRLAICSWDGREAGFCQSATISRPPTDSNTCQEQWPLQRCGSRSLPRCLHLLRPALDLGSTYEPQHPSTISGGPGSHVRRQQGGGSGGSIARRQCSERGGTALQRCRLKPHLKV